jgi:hypothetical protein
MPLTNLRACLTLGALLCSLPVLADAPAAPIAGEMHWQTLLLQHVVPGDILKALHWDKAAGLPAGVTNVYALQSNNSLLVRATPAGFAQVRDLVRVLDVEPRRVQIRFALAHATDAGLKASGVIFESAPLPSLLTVPMPDTKYATGNGVAALLQALTRQGAVTQSPVLTTSNNVDAGVTFSTPSQSLGVASVTFAATPRVNSDDSVTLVLHPSFSDGTVKREIRTLRTVRSGDTMVLVLPSPIPDAGGKNLLLFVTPTLLSGGSGPAAMTVK